MELEPVKNDFHLLNVVGYVDPNVTQKKILKEVAEICQKALEQNIKVLSKDRKFKDLTKQVGEFKKHILSQKDPQKFEASFNKIQDAMTGLVDVTERKDQVHYLEEMFNNVCASRMLHTKMLLYEIKNFIGENYVLKPELKKALTKFFEKDPQHQIMFKKFMQLAQVAKEKNREIASSDKLQIDPHAHYIKEVFIYEVDNLSDKVCEIKEICNFINEIKDRFVYPNTQVHEDGMMLRLEPNATGGTEVRWRKGDEIAASNPGELKGYHPRGDSIWQKPEWQEENPGKEIFVKGDRVITFKSTNGSEKQARAALDLTPLGDLTHEECVEVFRLIKGNTEPTLLTREQLAKAIKIAEEFNAKITKGIMLALITLDE